MSEGFFSRWSRQKRASAESRATQALPVDPPAAMLEVDQASATTVAQPLEQRPPATVSASAQASLPTLDDVQALTPASDFQPFMQRGVGAEIRNAAMKKLFADPHFNVMDGLDIYIDDYSQPDPMPVGMLRKMASAQFLGLVPPQAPAEQARPGQDPEGLTGAAQNPEVVAQSPDSSAKAEPPRHDHTDLQLQPDPSLADPASGPGAR